MEGHKPEIICIRDHKIVISPRITNISLSHYPMTIQILCLTHN